MEKIVTECERSKVVYNLENKTYTKYFYPKAIKKIKFLLKLRNYPGENCNYISKIFEKNEIKVARVLEYTNYSITTKEIKGKSLAEELLNCQDNSRKEKLINKYIVIVSQIINLGIYFGDFHFGNFILSNDELYVIDLEDYRKDFVSRFKRKSVLKRLRRYLLRINEIYNVNLYDGEKIFNKILTKINK